MTRHLIRHDSHAKSESQGGSGRKNRRGPLQVSLEIARGQALHKLRPVAGPAFLIGSASDCDLVLGDPQFSEVHAYLRVDAEQVTIRHLGFQPAISVNGEAISHVALADGDRIRTGPYEFIVHIGWTVSDDDRLATEFALDLPARSRLVEDEIGTGLVQQLLADIRQAAMPAAARLRVFAGPHGNFSDSETSAQQRRYRYARSV